MATTEHCLACFEALEAHLSKRKPLSLDEIQASFVTPAAASSSAPKGLQDPALRRIAADTESSSSSSTSLAASTPATSTSSLPLGPPSSAPLFVTWNTVEDDDDVSLRGCIGTFESQALSDGIPEYALISALYDNRFPPIRKSELATLQVAVTLLTDFEEVDDAFDWEIGVHGIRLSFYDRGRRYGSTYLPDVAAEQGWTKDETLFSLVRKAGWTGSRSKWKDLDLKVTRYRGKKKTLEYSDYQKWREGIES
ncbi:AMMECR1 domain-containing protein [Thelonectria olida]|uniref:AMMECR1 domain-containing protein n=1 Tax=Thelonectria olida TaxID=1576542 RepID=A0A9P8WIK5_9HYPO|nr:AMMECR1 domain-containing protein [Thelonectria olida]